MIRRPRPARLAVIILVSLSMLAPVAMAEAQSALPQEGSPSADCKELGEVVGTHFDASPQMDSARESALRDARDLGATLVKVVPEKTYQSGAYEVTYTAIAYRCPGPTAAVK